MTTVDLRERIAPVFPAGYPRARRLMPLMTPTAWDVRNGREWRRKASRDPLLFALLYLTPYLRDETTGTISVSRMHLAIYDRLAGWRDGGPDRSTWTSHRTAGKTTKWFLEAPTYGAVHAGRDFCLMLSNTSDQVRPHLATLKAAIEDGGSLLLHDFPELRPARPWTATDAVTRGGCRFLAAGMDKNILGTRQRERRPRLIVGDDLEPGAADWTPQSKAKTLARLVNDIIPAGSQNAAIVITGTPVAPGSLMHDVKRAAEGRPGAGEDRGEWVRAKGFAPHWYPAIVNAGTDREESAWPSRWPLPVLKAEQANDPRTFALQYMCDPDDPAAVQWWTDDPATSVFRIDRFFRADWRILSIDGAVTSKRTDVDHTALVLLAVGPGFGASRKVCVEYAQAGSWSRVELRERAWALTERYPKTLRTWLVEVNHGGEMWEEALTPPPPGVTLEPYHVQGSKRHRIESLYDEYVRGAIWHSAQHAALEGQMTAWKPSRSGHGIDDLIDATGAAVRRALYGDASKAPARRGERTR